MFLRCSYKSVLTARTMAVTMFALAVLWVPLLTPSTVAQPESAVTTATGPEDAETTARAAIAAEDWEALFAAGEAWLRLDPGPVPHAVLGYCSLQRQEFNEATRHFARLAIQEDVQEWVAWTEETVEEHPDSAVAYLLRGDARARKGEFQAALDDLSQVVTKRPSFSLAYAVRGVVRGLAGDEDGAMEDLEAAPDSADAYCNRGLIHCLKGEYEAAIADLSRAVEIAPDFAAAHNALGVARFLAGDFPGALQEFEVTVGIDGEFKQGQENRELLGRVLSQGRLPHDIAQNRKRGRAGTLTARYNLGIFGTGINSEADFDYAITHANSLPSDREKRFLYVGFESAQGPEVPLPGVEKARQRSDFEVVVATPNNWEAASQSVNDFVSRTVASGYDPIVFVDINKIVPAQLGGDRSNRTIGGPAEIAASANATFHRTVGDLGTTGISRIGGHSDFTWPTLQATEIATARYGTPFDFAYVESVRSEDWLKQGITVSPDTHFTNVFTSKGDFFTQEAQNRVLHGQISGAYRETLDQFRGIKAPNYTGIEIKNPTEPMGLGQNLFRGEAHSDPANFVKPFQVDVWQQGIRQESRMTTLGDFYRSQTMPDSPASSSSLSHLQLPPLDLGLDDDLTKRYPRLFGGGPPPPPPGGGGAAALRLPEFDMGNAATDFGLLPKGILIELPDECFEEAGGPASSESLQAASQAAARQRDGNTRRPRAIRADFPLFAGTDVSSMD